MKNLELQSFSVQELDAKEIREIDGGFPWAIIPVGIYLYDNRDKFIEGVKKGLNDFI